MEPLFVADPSAVAVPAGVFAAASCLVEDACALEGVPVDDALLGDVDAELLAPDVDDDDGTDVDVGADAADDEAGDGADGIEDEVELCPQALSTAMPPVITAAFPQEVFILAS